NAVGDLGLLRAARGGDRLAFGLLYLRHHAAAWRLACVASRFSPDAELALIEGFTRVFSALPDNPEDSDAGGVSFRPYLLACVRQAAVDRARAAGRAEGGAAGGPGPPPGDEIAPPAGLGPDGEVVLAGLEHHAGRGALAALDERSRTALWLADVDRARQAARGRHEVRAECRFAADHLEAYRAATLDPAEGVAVRAHLEACPPCRMRHEELADGRAALAAAIPEAPLLGGETQHHWLAASAGLRPAPRLLPPGAAAARASGRRLPAALRRAGQAAAHAWRPSPADQIDLTGPAVSAPSPEPIDLTGPAVAAGTTGAGGPDEAGAAGWTALPGASGSMAPPLPPEWTVPPARTTRPPRPARRPRRRSGARPAGRVPALTRRMKDTVWPAVPAAGLAVAWVAVMLSLPWLITPKTTEGPDGQALPAVQAYVPDFLPGAGGHSSGRAGHPGGAAARGTGLSGGADGSGTTGLATAADAGRVGAGSAALDGDTAADTTIGLVAAVLPHRPTGPARHRPVTPVPVPAVATPAVDLLPVPAPGTVVSTTTGPDLTPAPVPPVAVPPVAVPPLPVPPVPPTRPPHPTTTTTTTVPPTTGTTGPSPDHPKHGRHHGPPVPDAAVATLPDWWTFTTPTIPPDGWWPGGPAGTRPRSVTA